MKPSKFVITGFLTPVWVRCPSQDTAPINLLVKYRPRIDSLSRTYVRENQYHANNTVTLRGEYFESWHICTMRDSLGRVMEAPLFLFLSHETVTCNISGLFQAAAEPVEISLKEYNT